MQTATKKKAQAVKRGKAAFKKMGIRHFRKIASKGHETQSKLRQVIKLLVVQQIIAKEYKRMFCEDYPI